ncbi:FMN-linked oxidoreductase [Pholiota conissans]|uniref:FMN-linked oxidoreductase n=1 Tax=Pholiota conissans TaxID=109636 RepID=A0A9P5ZB87_9AGAR|nr:FMN-linked oxidoreductase [Pholiota conissans]
MPQNDGIPCCRNPASSTFLCTAFVSPPPYQILASHILNTPPRPPNHSIATVTVCSQNELAFAVFCGAQMQVGGQRDTGFVNGFGYINLTWTYTRRIATRVPPYTAIFTPSQTGTWSSLHGPRRVHTYLCTIPDGYTPVQDMAVFWITTGPVGSAPVSRLHTAPVGSPTQSSKHPSTSAVEIFENWESESKLYTSKLYMTQYIRVSRRLLRNILIKLFDILTQFTEFNATQTVDPVWTVTVQASSLISPSLTHRSSSSSSKNHRVEEPQWNGVQLHGAGGYLVNQFLDSGSNKRTDKWGGSIENRSRFGLEVLKVLTQVYPRDVAIKISPSGGYNDVGMPLQETLDTYSYFISEVDKLGLSFIELMRYSAKFDVEYDGVRRATRHDVLESYRPFVKNTKLFLNADITPEEGEALVSAGKVDGVTFGFNFITHPDLVKRVQNGKPFDNAPDIAHLQTNKDSGDWATGYTDYPTATY